MDTSYSVLDLGNHLQVQARIIDAEPSGLIKISLYSRKKHGILRLGSDADHLCVGPFRHWLVIQHARLLDAFYQPPNLQEARNLELHTCMKLTIVCAIKVDSDVLA